MNKSEHFENSVPEDYVLAKNVDAKSNKKIIAVYTLLSFVPFIIITPVLLIIARYCNGYDISDGYKNDFGRIALLVTCVVLFVYVILHELVHGITYKIFTGSKLTFGITLTVAFCGVPDIYVRKKASIAALIMPFTVFSVIFIALTVGLWFVSPLYGIFSGAIFAIHLGGCVGDLHWTLLYLTKFKSCNTLMRDTGPTQWLYIPKSEAGQYGIDYIANDNSEVNKT